MEERNTSTVVVIVVMIDDEVNTTTNMKRYGKHYLKFERKPLDNGRF